MTTEIRLARNDDSDRVVPLLVAQLREHDIPVSEAHVARKVTKATRDGEVIILVALSDARIVGVAYVSFAEPLEHEGTVAWLEELYVVPELRERGIGGKLLERVLAIAEEHGCVGVELETKRGHERASHLYTRQGFRDLGRHHYARPLTRWDWPQLE